LSFIHQFSWFFSVFLFKVYWLLKNLRKKEFLMRLFYENLFTLTNTPYKIQQLLYAFTLPLASFMIQWYISQYRPVGLFFCNKGSMSNTSRGVETQHAILNTALELFSKNGYDATSVAEICESAKVSKGAFYHHFPSKQDLFLDLMRTWLEDVNGLFQSAEVGTANIPQVFDNMAGFSGEFFDALEGGFPILLEFWTQANRQPAVWQRVVEPYHQFLNFFTELVRTGMDQGAFEKSLDAEVAARVITAVAMGLLLQATFDPKGTDWQEVTRSGIKLLINGMRSDG
jgi:AcrR family transcriptional regulator